MNSQQCGEVDVLYLSGRFDAYEVANVAAWLNRQIDAGRFKIVINLGGVTFIDSAALSTLVQAMKRARQHNGDCHLSTLQQPVRIIFELTRLNRAFAIYADEAAAVRAFAEDTQPSAVGAVGIEPQPMQVQ